MNRIVLANWKAHVSPANGGKWLADFLGNYQAVDGIEVILAVPVVCLQKLSEQLMAIDGVQLASQQVSSYPSGNYTGSTPASWLKGLAAYVLTGHREQRRYFHLTLQDVANQVTEAVSAGLKPILCLERKDAPQQIAALDQNVRESVVMAYTPSDAEQLEIAQSEGIIIETVEYFSALSGGRPVLYGGGVQEDNAGYLMSLPGVSGIMAGRGCLDPTSFAALVRKVAAASTG
jgi:triosephosphate isomerase